jgi:predicted DNA-binding transcriptional regulator YafY
MDRSERFYRMQALLRANRLVSRQQFLDELEVSLATFKRDLEYLRDRIGFPIVYDKDRGGYRVDDAVADRTLHELPGLWFSGEELLALLTMDRLTAQLQPGVLDDSLAPLRERIAGLLRKGGYEPDAIARRIRVLTMQSRRVESATFRAIATALLNGRRIQLRHRRRADGETLDREVSPQRLVHYRDNWYLDAWCHRRQALRSFALDAIERVQVAEKAAKSVAEDTLDRHFASGYGIFGGHETSEAQLLFTPQAARWVAGETWHPKQDGRLQLDGSYLLKFPYTREPELVMDVLKYGPEVEVLAPDSLREAVATRLSDALARYRPA